MLVPAQSHAVAPQNRLFVFHRKTATRLLDHLSRALVFGVISAMSVSGGWLSNLLIPQTAVHRFCFSVDSTKISISLIF